MKKFMKRLAGVALTLAMMVTMLPAQSAYAARKVEKQETEEQIVWEHFDEEYYLNHETNLDETGFVLYNMIEPLVGSWDDGNVIITEDWDIILKRSNEGTVYTGLQTVIDYGTSTYIYNNPTDVAFAANCSEKEAAEYKWPANRYYVYEPSAWMGSKYPDGQKVPLSEVLETYAEDYLGLNKPEPTPEPAPTETPVEDKEVVGKTSDGRPYYKNEEVYKVVKGDCLWTIANRFYGNGKKYVELFERNNSLIKKPELIYTGWEIVIPVQNK